MPIRTVPGTDLTYYLISFDAAGRERTDDPDGPMSRQAVDALANEPFSDVFFLSHGWKGDVPAAIAQYDGWIGTMARATADLERIRQARPGFRPLIIGLHWPSEPWGNEVLGGAAAFAAAAGPSVEELADRYAERIADTPAARKALETIFAAAMDEIAPPTLPPAVREAYDVLNREAGLGSDGVGAAPGHDREPFDPEAAYQAAQEEEATSFGSFSLGGLLAPLQQLSFWTMKDRARHFGESGGYALLGDLQRAVEAGRDVRFHLMGHSFGCIVVSAILAGPDGRGSLVRPVDSLVLVQGALSLWSYCSEIPPAPGVAGYFRSIIADHKVRGPIITTQTEFDTAVGRFYPMGAGVAGQVAFAPGELPKYGALGTFGVRGPGTEPVDLEMLPTDATYGFEPGKIYNLESGRYICEGGGASGAHSDFLRPEVAHAVFEAALT